MTPDGKILEIESISDGFQRKALVEIQGISPLFIGYELEQENLLFNSKSTLAQLGINIQATHCSLNKTVSQARIEVVITALGPIAKALLDFLSKGMFIGKLFAKDPRRRVRDPDYLHRMFGRCDHKGDPLLALGGLEGGKDLILEKKEGRTIAFLSLLDGVVHYNDSIYGFLPLLAKILSSGVPYSRDLLRLLQCFHEGVPRILEKERPLFVRTAPLHIRTVYAHVAEEFLPKGFHHFNASILEPNTTHSGDVYELFGSSDQAIYDIPLEFYTLEPHREHVFFTDRDQLLNTLDTPENLFKAFASAPNPQKHLASVFVVKGTQMSALSAKDWILRDPHKQEFPGLAHPTRQALLAEKYIENQPQYPFLDAIKTGLISSQGVLLTRYFPTPLLKRLLLSDTVSRCLKRIYFQYPSLEHDDFFSHEDRSMLVDLSKFGIPVFWVDETSKKILQFMLRSDKEAGLFVPLDLVQTYSQATFFGVYGSNLQEGSFEIELTKLLQGIQKIQKNMNHPLLSAQTPLALVTGGGPGAMAIGNRVAKELGILSCANLVDFRAKNKAIVNEQKKNPHIEAKMTYRLDRLVERQAEFYLDFPIFLPGGIGTDFEYTLEEVRRKTGACPANPILLFGPADYWRQKITSRFQLNRKTGTIQGSEWISNCFYAIETADQGIEIYRRFFENRLPIGKEGPIFEEGFSSSPF